MFGILFIIFFEFGFFWVFCWVSGIRVYVVWWIEVLIFFLLFFRVCVIWWIEVFIFFLFVYCFFFYGYVFGFYVFVFFGIFWFFNFFC